VEENIGVGMTAQSEFSRYAHAAENQLAARLSAMGVPTLANPVSQHAQETSSAELSSAK
jgi:hypothetical protein